MTGIRVPAPAGKGVKMKRIAFVMPMMLASRPLPSPIRRPNSRRPRLPPGEQLKAAVKSFRLRLDYNGQERKPFYRFTLSVPPVGDNPKEPFSPQVQVTEEQAKKVIDFLAADGFLDQADDLEPGAIKKHPAPTMPGYTMKVDTAQVVFCDDLGWGLAMLKRLDGLRKVLDGDAAKQMDFILGRLAGHRKGWEKAMTKNEGRVVEKDGVVFEVVLSVQDGQSPRTSRAPPVPSSNWAYESPTRPTKLCVSTATIPSHRNW